MNFSGLKENYVNPALRILRCEDPARPVITASNEYVLGVLSTLPRLRGVYALQNRQKRFRPMNKVDKTLKVFCLCAGPHLVRAVEILGELSNVMASRSPGTGTGTATAKDYQFLLRSLRHIRVSLDYWELSIGIKAFYKKHPRPRDVRYEYLSYTLQLVHIITNLTFPEDLLVWVKELEDILGRPDRREQFILDSEMTYAWSKTTTRAGLTAPHHRYPKRFLLHGQTVVRPFWVNNSSVYGHLQVPNESCIQHRQYPPKVYLNMGRFNPWDFHERQR